MGGDAARLYFQLGAEFVEHLGVGLHEADEVFGLEDAKGAGVGAGFGEAIEFVPAGGGGGEENGLRMPGMAFERARSGVVAGDGEDVGTFLEENGEGGVKFFDGLFLGGEIAVFAKHIGVFVVDEEVVVVVVFGEVALELFGDGLRAFDFFHADELGEAFIHRIDGETGGLEEVTILEQGNVRLMGDAAHEKAVGGFLGGNDGEGLFVKFGDEFGSFFLAGGIGVGRSGSGNGEAFAIGVGVGEWAFKAFAAENDDEAMAFAGFDNDFGVANFSDFLGEEGAEVFGDFGFDAAGATVGDDAFGIEGAEIGAGGDVASLEFDAEAEGLDDAATNLKFHWIVPEEAEVAGAAARRDAGGDGNHAALGTGFGEGVKVGGDGGFEGGEKILFLGGDVAEAVEDNEDEFGAGLDGEIGVKTINVHGMMIGLKG